MITIQEYFSQSEKISSIDEYLSKDKISLINEYLLSKSKAKANFKDFNEEFCIVLAWEPIYSKIEGDCEDAKLVSDVGGPPLFLLRKTIAKELLKNAGYDYYNIYEIPDRYKTLKSFEEFEDSYANGEYEDLKEIKYDEL